MANPLKDLRARGGGLFIDPNKFDPCLFKGIRLDIGKISAAALLCQSQITAPLIQQVTINGRKIYIEIAPGAAPSLTTGSAGTPINLYNPTWRDSLIILVGGAGGDGQRLGPFGAAPGGGDGGGVNVSVGTCNIIVAIGGDAGSGAPAGDYPGSGQKGVMGGSGGTGGAVSVSAGKDTRVFVMGGAGGNGGAAGFGGARGLAPTAINIADGGDGGDAGNGANIGFLVHPTVSGKVHAGNGGNGASGKRATMINISAPIEGGNGGRAGHGGSVYGSNGTGITCTPGHKGRWGRKGRSLGFPTPTGLLAMLPMIIKPRNRNGYVGRNGVCS